jgi:hypothetical protein
MKYSFRLAVMNTHDSSTLYTTSVLTFNMSM